MIEKPKLTTEIIISETTSIFINSIEWVRLKILGIFLNRNAKKLSSNQKLYHLSNKKHYKFNNLSNINDIEIYYHISNDEEIIKLNIPISLKEKLIEYLKNKEKIEDNKQKYDCGSFISYLNNWDENYKQTFIKIEKSLVDKIKVWITFCTFEKIEDFKLKWVHYFISLWNWLYLSKLWNWVVAVTKLEELEKAYSFNNICIVR